MDAATTETVKGKTKKPFQWTEARKAAFERCKKAREEKLVHKCKTEKDEKASGDLKKKQIQSLLKNANLLRKLLDGVDLPTETTQKQVEDTESKPVEKPAEKSNGKPKEKKTVKPPPPPPVEESESEEEVEEEPEPPPKPPPRIVNKFRYTNTSSSKFIPRPPLPTNQREPTPIISQAPKSKFLFL